MPVFQEVLAFFGYRVADYHSYGDHTLYIAQVEQLEISPSQAALISSESKYITL